jgi:hypothetical protein
LYASPPSSSSQSFKPAALPGYCNIGEQVAAQAHSLFQASNPSRPPQLITPNKRQFLSIVSSRAAPCGPPRQSLGRANNARCGVSSQRPGRTTHQREEQRCAIETQTVSSQRHSAPRHDVLSAADETRRLMFQDALRRNIIAQSALLPNNTFQVSRTARHAARSLS